MSDQAALFDLTPAAPPPAAPVEVPAVALPELEARPLSKFEMQVKTNERRGRMRPRRLVKLKCEHCPWTDKVLPIDTPEACPSCSRTGCLVMIGWAAR